MSFLFIVNFVIFCNVKATRLDCTIYIYINIKSNNIMVKFDKCYTIESSRVKWELINRFW